jgi:uncharacterized membrane protein YhaH (DUF805 family)
MEHFLNAFKNYANFSGRARRKEYWMFFLIYSLLYVGLSFIDGLLGSAWLSSIFSLVLLIPSISYAARRLHDTGRSGWWQLLYLIPLIGIIVVIVFLAQDSHEENEYGISPKFA